MFRNLVKIRKEKGTALITALLVMGVLTAISLSVSALIVREISITRLAIDSGKAYYAAEAGIEEALLKLNDGNVGVSRDVTDVVFSDEDGIGKATYKIENTSNTYPVVNEEMESDNAESYYAYLDINESVTIPLFTGAGEDSEDKVNEFVVQYFVDLDGKDFIFNANTSDIITGWDVLRWKVYGIVPDGGINKGRTESINDFTPVSFIATVNESGEQISTRLANATSPSWFGTKDHWNSGDSGEYNYFTMDDDIDFTSYETSEVTKGPLKDTQTVFQGSCSRTEAMEHYRYTDNSMDVIPCYPIADFLREHNQNYLVLTNLMNPSVLNDENENLSSQEQRFAKSRLYYRVVTVKSMPREFAEITATGAAGDSKITLSMLRKRDSFMPVFNFALYHTKEDPLP